jgi:hypothetical protein
MPAQALTGRWTGYYVQKDQHRAIAAELVQRNDRLEGAMHDLQTRFEMSVYEMAAECGLPPGADEQIVAKLRQEHADQARGPIRALMTLPDESTVQGNVRGQSVYFRKTYTGEAFSGYSVGSKEVGVRVMGHCVHYRGTLSDDGQSLEGTWWIEADLKKNLRRCEGPFLLRREGASAS